MIAVLAVALAAAPVQPPAGPARPAFEFRRVRDDVYQAIGTGAMAVGANAAVIINADEVLLVDSHTSPAAARALLRELKRLTPKPVRFVVNTHFHYDHAHGNQVYPPSVAVIGHEFTRTALATGASRENAAYRGYLDFIAAAIDTARRALDTIRDPARRAAARSQLAKYRAAQAAERELRPTPPNWTIRDQVTLYRGGREIRIGFFGRGHTGGDVVVYLPQERVLVTGDLVGDGRIPYLGDGYLDEWAATLERLGGLDVEAILPGHGAWFTDRAAFGRLAGLLRDFHRQVLAAHAAGLGRREAAGRIDLSAHAQYYPQLTADPAGTKERIETGVARTYDILEGRAR